MARRIYNAARGLVGAIGVFPVAERLEGRDIRGRQAALAAEMNFPFSTRRRRSWNRLVDTVRFAGSRVPYYRDLFAKLHFDPDKLARDAGYLKEIPPLTKDIIREQGERMLREDHAGQRKHVTKSGGSTGPSTHVIYDQDAADWSSAVTRYARARIGAGPTRAELHLASHFGDAVPIRDRLREQLKCIANNRFNLELASFAPHELDRMWRRIRAIRPHLLHGHSSTLYQLAVHVQARGEAARAFRVFESSGELLGANQREMIERVFGCRVVDRYGLAEAGVVAYQTDAAADGMTVFDPVVWPEILDVETASGGSRGDDECGELIVTPLANRMMPLIRYRTGDVAALRETGAGFVLRALMGRVHDVVELGGVPVPTHHVQDVLDRIGGICQFQIENGSDRPVIRIVPEANSCTEAIRRGVRRHWSDCVDVEFIGLGGLKRQGWRSKFRHLVTPAPAE